MSLTTLKQTPLNAIHRNSGGKMVDYGGWDMPVQYASGVIEEHMATRTRAGLFDVSHMGEIWVEGPDAIAFVNRLVTNDATKLSDGQAHYTAMTNENAGIVDDLLVYRFNEQKLLLVVNAGTTDKDWEWITSHATPDDNITLTNASADYCQIAIQGPKATEILQTLTETDLSGIKYYWFTTGSVDSIEGIISRTGYTGEDGFEFYASADKAEHLWNKIMEAGAEAGLIPCGLAARNTLRLEAGMSLYGHELTDDITPLEAGLGWITKLDKGDFTGSDVLKAQKEAGVTRKIVGFEMISPGIARDEYEVFSGDEKIGIVTSGSPAPFIKSRIGFALIGSEFANIGQSIQIDVRGKKLEAVIVKTPFYKRQQ